MIDSHHNKFQDALLGGFEAPLHNGRVIPLYQISLTDPHINELLQAYVHLAGFDMSGHSDIAQLHTTVCLYFVSITLPTLNPNLVSHATREDVVIGLGNVTPLILGFAALTLPDEWNAHYMPLSQKLLPSSESKKKYFSRYPKRPCLKIRKNPEC